MAEPGKVAYISRVRIERQEGRMRLAYLPAEKEPVTFGLPSELAAHCKVSTDAYPMRATMLDYVIGAAGG